MTRAAIVLVALLSTGCASSFLSVIRSAGSHERQAERISARITTSSAEVLRFLGIGKASRQEASLAFEQIQVARTFVDRSSLGLTTAVLGLGRQSRVTADLDAADAIVDDVEKLLRVWESRPLGPANDVPLPVP